MSIRVGLIGTGAIARLHAAVYRRIGYTLRACTNPNQAAGEQFARDHATEFVPAAEQICSHPEVDFVDVCTRPDFRLQAVELCARYGKPAHVEKPMAADLETAARMLAIARDAGIPLGVVSQHRFDDSTRFVANAIRDGRLGRLLQCDAYVKWFRPAEYYGRPVKGTWAGEGGGALITQGIHQVDLVRALAGPAIEVAAAWQLGAAHDIESEDVVSAVVRFASGATGVIQASTAFWPGYPERLEIHGTRGTAIIAGDALVTWNVRDDDGETPPLLTAQSSGASDPMAIGLEAFGRQFLDFGQAIRERRPPEVSGQQGYEALELVDAIYRACRLNQIVRLSS
jgi:predicted dehydrogenase